MESVNSLALRTVLDSWRTTLRIRLSDFLGLVTLLLGRAPGISRGGAPWLGLGIGRTKKRRFVSGVWSRPLQRLVDTAFQRAISEKNFSR
jgi:hypothetical protein